MVEIFWFHVDKERDTHVIVRQCLVTLSFATCNTTLMFIATILKIVLRNPQGVGFLIRFIPSS
jgi:hypothetical protein